MKHFLIVIFLIALLVHCFPVVAEASAADPASAAGWTIRLAGVLQVNGNEWVNWYTVIPPSGTLGSQSASNGTQGISFGLDLAADYRIGDRFVLGFAAGFVPTRLHAELHHNEINGIVIEKPKANISFMPVRVVAGYDLFRGPGWSVQAGLQCGLGLFGSKDVIPAVGRARHFSNDNRMLFGAQVRFSRTSSSGWGYSATLQHLRSGFKVEELGTLAMPQKLDFNPTSFLVGVHYSFAAGKQ